MASNRSGRKTKDLFVNSLKVTQAAIAAAKQVSQSEERACYIEELSLKAHVEVRKLRNVAKSLATTAVAVAKMALDLCSYDSYRQAFREHPEYQEIVPYEEFIDFVATESSPAHRECHVTEPSANHWAMNRRDGCYSTNLWKPRISGKHGNDSQLEDSGRFSNKSNLRAQPRDVQEVILDDWVEPDVLLEPVTKVRNKRPPKTVHDLAQDEENLGDKSKVKVDSTEKFPSATPDEYRCHLARSFENTSCIAPLWEDRYVDVKERESLSQHNTERWTGKKAMRQFQIKLQQAHLDDTASVEDGFHGIPLHYSPHGSSSASPDHCRKSIGAPQQHNVIQGSVAIPSTSDPESPEVAERNLNGLLEESSALPTDLRVGSPLNSGQDEDAEKLDGKPGKRTIICLISTGETETFTVKETPDVFGGTPQLEYASENAGSRPPSSNTTSKEPQERRSRTSHASTALRESNSSDSEVEEILKEPLVMRRLRKTDLHQPITCLVPPRSTRQTRPISPLLSSNKKENYSLSGDESPLSPATTPPPILRFKHVYRPLGKTETHLETSE